MAAYALGWIADKPDPRDRVYMAAPRFVGALPPRVDLSDKCCPVYDQGQIGSCAPNASVSAFRYALHAAGLPDFDGSRLFLYYNARVMLGTPKQDSGSSIRDNFKSMAKQGLAPERLWPYSPMRFASHPPMIAYTAAKDHQAIEYERVTQSLTQLKSCLAEGWPIVFGFQCFASMFTPTVEKSGVIPMPGPLDSNEGGHAVKLVGYDDATGRFKFKNSWSVRWGDKGYGRLPYEYVTSKDLAADFWRVRVVEG